jgi:hypothetical protein
MCFDRELPDLDVHVRESLLDVDLAILAALLFEYSRVYRRDYWALLGRHIILVGV